MGNSEGSKAVIRTEESDRKTYTASSTTCVRFCSSWPGEYRSLVRASRVQDLRRTKSQPQVAVRWRAGGTTCLPRLSWTSPWRSRLLLEQLCALSWKLLNLCNFKWRGRACLQPLCQPCAKQTFIWRDFFACASIEWGTDGKVSLLQIPSLSLCYASPNTGISDFGEILHYAWTVDQPVDTYSLIWMELCI